MSIGHGRQRCERTSNHNLGSHERARRCGRTSDERGLFDTFSPRRNCSGSARPVPRLLDADPHVRDVRELRQGQRPLCAVEASRPEALVSRVERKLTLYRDDSTSQVVFDRVKAWFWTAGNTVLVISRYNSSEGAAHHYIHWPRERFCWFRDEPQAEQPERSRRGEE